MVLPREGSSCPAPSVTSSGPLGSHFPAWPWFPPGLSEDHSWSDWGWGGGQPVLLTPSRLQEGEAFPGLQESGAGSTGADKVREGFLGK